MASSVLLVIVLAVAASVSSAQKVAWESRKRMLATFAADGMLAELMTLDYFDIRDHDGDEEDIGEMETIDGEDYPDTFWALGRDITVTDTTVTDVDTGIIVAGIDVRVAVFDQTKDLSILTAFVAEPAP